MFKPPCRNAHTRAAIPLPPAPEPYSKHLPRAFSPTGRSLHGPQRFYLLSFTAIVAEMITQ